MWRPGFCRMSSTPFRSLPSGLQAKCKITRTRMLMVGRFEDKGLLTSRYAVLMGCTISRPYAYPRLFRSSTRC